jgi:hypothetical protein
MGSSEKGFVPSALKAIRCHDITVSLGNKPIPQFDQLMKIGMAVRLALHLRGVQAVTYDLLKLVAWHLLNIPSMALPSIVELLAEVEYLRLDKQGNTIRSVVPTVPYYDDMFIGIGEVAEDQTLSEPEQLTLHLIERLAKSPTVKETIYNDTGADKQLVTSMIDVGIQGGYVIGKRARGRDMLLSPIYFGENAAAFADLAAGYGSGRVAKVVKLLVTNQGWPLSLIQKTQRIGEVTLSQEDINIIISFAGDGFSPPPMISTSHAGDNHFLFSPKPGMPRIGPGKRQIYETAMALVAAVRQGQLLPAAYRIKFPELLLQRLLDRKCLNASSEALEQYRTVATMRLGRLVPVGDRHRFDLIETPENIEAVKMAIQLVQGAEAPPGTQDDVILAFKKGQTYVESLVGRQKLVELEKIKPDAETQREIDDFLLG